MNGATGLAGDSPDALAEGLRVAVANGEGGFAADGIVDELAAGPLDPGSLLLASLDMSSTGEATGRLRPAGEGDAFPYPISAKAPAPLAPDPSPLDPATVLDDPDAVTTSLADASELAGPSEPLAGGVDLGPVNDSVLAGFDGPDDPGAGASPAGQVASADTDTLGIGIFGDVEFPSVASSDFGPLPVVRATIVEPDMASVAEPVTVLMLALGVIGMLGAGRRRAGARRASPRLRLQGNEA